jgi:hypothetical protein
VPFTLSGIDEGAPPVMHVQITQFFQVAFIFILTYDFYISIMVFYVKRKASFHYIEGGGCTGCDASQWLVASIRDDERTS